MGFANDIINMAFGLLLGAIAVAIAIAFGVGGHEFAARKLEEWETSLKEKNKCSSNVMTSLHRNFSSQCKFMRLPD